MKESREELAKIYQVASNLIGVKHRARDIRRKQRTKQLLNNVQTDFEQAESVLGATFKGEDADEALEQYDSSAALFQQCGLAMKLIPREQHSEFREQLLQLIESYGVTEEQLQTVRGL